MIDLRHFYDIISIHSARVGGDVSSGDLLYLRSLFQSTPPVWAETKTSKRYINRSRFQSTPPVWAETEDVSSVGIPMKFQSTPPVWAETRSYWSFAANHLISIHSARVGGDQNHMQMLQAIGNFNPLRPCGRRRFDRLHDAVERRISIHSARVGGDVAPFTA